jgi:hypothetical protein
MALKTWDAIGNLGLTNNQKNIAAAFEAIGIAAKPHETPDISGVTAAQAKAVRNFIHDLARLQFALRGAEYVLHKLQVDAAKTALDSVPDGGL